jgi:hypothetical protein
MLYPTSAQRTYLFTDYHNVFCGDLEWKDLNGTTVPLNNPPEPVRTVVASRGAMPYGIRLVAQKAQKIGPIATDMYLPSGLRYENGIYRAWFAIGPTCESCGYAESTDGISWKRPKFKEPTASDPTGNAVFGPEWAPELSRFAGFMVFKDDHAEPAERYKMIFMARPPARDIDAILARYSKGNPLVRSNAPTLKEYTRDDLVCVQGAVSPDGIQWKPLPEHLFIHFCDGFTVYFDHWLQRYVMYTREYSRQRRLISRTESEDFRHWSPVVPLIGVGTDERPTLDIYSSGFTQYPGEPDIRLMFPQVYDRWDQTSHLRLSSSPDGYLWYEIPGGPVLSHGAPGEWDAEYLAVGTGLVPFGSDRVGVIYEGSPYPHKYPRWKATHPEAVRRSGWAWWPEGRLCALKADEVGEFHTFPMKPRGTKLQLNFRTYRAGSVRVGIEYLPEGRDRSSVPLWGLPGVQGFLPRPGFGIDDCDALVGDSLRQTVSWKGRTEIDIGEGRDVVLHLKMRCAELFSITWA